MAGMSGMPGQALLEYGRLLDVLGIEGELLNETAHAIAPDTPVPTCPGWAASEVVRHVGSVYRMTLSWLEHGRRPRHWQRDPAPGESVHEYLNEGRTRLVGALARHDPGEFVATWWPADRSYGFWRRRMAHETTIHRVDLQMAGGLELTGIADDLAIDGVDEVLALWFGQRLPMLGLTGTRASSVAVRAGDQVWLVTAGPEETTAWRCSEREIPGADAVVSGRPAQVYLWLWGRAAPGSITVEEGDDDAVGQMWALLRLATR